MQQAVFKTPDQDHILSAPPFVQVELSTGCNQKCIHCYNFWREDNPKPVHMSREKLDLLIEEFISNKVLHVVLSGGEPFLNFDNLVYAINRLTDSGISVSVNSNLTLATPEKIEQLRRAGLPHILTSLDADNEEINALMTSTKGAFEKIIRGIKATLEGGIRVSINMVISHHNIGRIYETAKLANDLGVQKFNVTRTIPVVSKDSPHRKEFEICSDEAKKMLDVSLEIEKDFNFDAVGTMIPYPYCFLGNLDKYKLVLDKCSCVAGTKLMSINVNGDVHACVHESTVYGNVFKDGLKNAWEKLEEWHKRKYFPEDCKTCAYFDLCVAGCRMAAKAYDQIDGDDNLKVGSSKITHSIAVKPTRNDYEIVEKEHFIIPPNLRFRKENNFYYVTTFGAKGVVVENDAAEVLKRLQKTQAPFQLSDVGQDNKEMLAWCLYHNLIERQGDVESKRRRVRNNEFIDK